MPRKRTGQAIRAQEMSRERLKRNPRTRVAAGGSSFLLGVARRRARTSAARRRIARSRATRTARWRTYRCACARSPDSGSSSSCSCRERIRCIAADRDAANRARSRIGGDAVVIAVVQQMTEDEDTVLKVRLVVAQVRAESACRVSSPTCWCRSASSPTAPALDVADDLSSRFSTINTPKTSAGGMRRR